MGMSLFNAWACSEKRAKSWVEFIRPGYYLTKESNHYIAVNKHPDTMKNPWKPDQYAHGAGEAVTTATKMLDKLDLFENDGVVAAVPFGKIVTD